jgi:hypothetical protein
MKKSTVNKMTRWSLLFIFCFSAWAQGIAQGVETTILKPVIKKDTVIIIQRIVDDSMTRNYQQILEKTNSQLSLLSNPYGLFVAMLGILFTVLTIIAAFIIYRQSKEYRELIKKSLEEHKIALDKLIIEKNNQLKIYETNLDNLIMENTEKLKTASKVNKKEIEKFIMSLEKQKEYFDKEIHTYKHKGWAPMDINEDYSIDQNTNFYADIKLTQLKQKFQIYIRVIASDNKKYWLGFGGGNKNDNFKSPNEYSRIQIYNSRQVIIQENIISAFKTGFPGSNAQPIKIDCVRLRASDSDLTEISFSYNMT